MLQSIADQPLAPGDEVLVIGDGHQPAAECATQAFGEPFRYLEGPSAHLFGDPQRNWAMPQARGTHLIFQDDDNIMLPWALGSARALAQLCPGRPLIFRVRYLNGHIAPVEPRLQLSDFDTACGIWPNVAKLLGTWPGIYGGDYHFAHDTLQLYPNGERDAIWCLRVIAAHRPHAIPGGYHPKKIFQEGQRASAAFFGCCAECPYKGECESS